MKLQIKLSELFNSGQSSISQKMPILVESCGNTVSSSIPMALAQLRAQNQLKSGAKLLLMGFGVGYSWAGCVVTI